MAIYNLSASVGTRAKGQSAAAKYDYITRGGKYAEDGAEVERIADGNLPAWAQDNPRDYWQAADEGERANGSLFREVQFALPEELSRRERQELAEGFARELTTGEEKLPYTLAVHRGDGVNPHAHLLISERVNDGAERTAGTWFRRFNGQAPERGGARKTRALQAPRGLESRDWLTATRAAWERRANEALEWSGSEERIDRRSWSLRREEALKRGDLEEAARCSRIPNVHRGPRRRQRGGLERKDRRVRAENERLDSEVARLDKRIAAVEVRIAKLDHERLALAARIAELSQEEREVAKIAAATIQTAMNQPGGGGRSRPPARLEREAGVEVKGSEEAPRPEPTRWQRFQQRRKRRRSEASRKRFVKQAADRVIEQLEKGRAPWQQEWRSAQDSHDPPYNPVTGERYDGLNAIVLRCEDREQYYDDPRWLTYNQAKRVGVQVRKGEQGTRLEYWRYPPKEESGGKDAGAEAGREKSEAVHRTYTVFNARQCKEMPWLYKSVRDWDACKRAARLLAASGAAIEHDSEGWSIYQEKEDKIVLPGPERLISPERYYALAMREMGRWTGHEKRLDRETLRQGNEEGDGSDAQAREDLRAAMISMTVDGVLSLPHHQPQHRASDVDAWIKVLKNDPEELRRAVRDADAAVKHLLQYDREPPPEPEHKSVDLAPAPTPERIREVSQQLERGYDLSDDLMSW